MRLALLLTFFATCSVLATPPVIPELLATRPDKDYIEIKNWGGTMGISEEPGFIVWTPTLTLEQAISAAGGFTRRLLPTIDIQRRGNDRSRDLHFLYRDYLHSTKIQTHFFRAGDRINIHYFIPPF